MRVMRNKNDWMQKKSIIIIILVVLLLVAILAVAAELGMKSGGRPNKIIEKIRMEIIMKIILIRIPII